MKVLKSTSESGFPKKHRHAVYLNDDDPMTAHGQTSLDDDHRHEIIWTPPVEAQVDEMGNEVAPGQPGFFSITPGPDGHEHEIQDYELMKSKKDDDDSDTVKEVLALYRAAVETDIDSLEKAKEAEDFYWGDQWDESTRKELEALARACITINAIAKNIDALDGYYRQQRTEFKFLPMEGGDQKVADILNILMKHITEQCFFEREESKVFKDAAITGRGFFNIYVSFDKDFRGDIVIERMPWNEVRCGEHEKEDLDDCEHIHKTKMYSLAKATQLWEDKADELAKKVVHEDSSRDRYAQGKEIAISIKGEIQLDTTKKEVRVRETWQKKYHRAKVAVLFGEDFYQNLDGWRPADIKSVATMDGFRVVERNTTKFRITRTAGNVVLSDENPANLPVDDFFLIPVYAKKRGNRFQGKVEIAKDAQRELNKRRSQAIDIGNKMAAYGWFFDEMTFPDKTEEGKFRDESSSPGFTVKVNDINRLPQKVEGTKFPSELVGLMTLDLEAIRDYMDVSPEPPGANTSGTAIMRQQQTKLTGNEFLFEAMSFSKKLLGRRVVPLIQRYYPPERIIRILRERDKRDPITIGGNPLGNFTDEEILTLLQTQDLTRNDVIVSESANSPSAMMGAFNLLLEMAQAGQQIPSEVIVELSALPTSLKEKLKVAFQQGQAAQAKAAQATRSMEIEKTLIAQGMIPPNVQAEFLQQQPAPTPGVEGQAAIEDTQGTFPVST
jgi:hypothetical protein